MSVQHLQHSHPNTPPSPPREMAFLHGVTQIRFDIGRVSLLALFVLSLPCLLSLRPQAMKNSVLGPEFEKQSAAPAYNEAKRSLKLKRKVRRPCVV